MATQLLLILTFFSPDIGLAQSSTGTTKYRIEFAWEEVEDAIGYNLEFENTSVGGKFKFKTKKAAFDNGLIPGTYTVRIRSLDERGVPGEWSEKSQLVVFPPDPDILSPKKRAISKAFKRAPVKFSWKSVPGVKEYLVKVKSDDFEEEKRVKGTSTKIKVPVGKKISWQVYSLVDSVDESLLAASINRFVHVGATPAPKVLVPTNEFVESVEWEKVDVANRYKYKLYRKVDGKWKGVRRGKTSKLKMKVPRKLSGGDYKIKVFAKGKHRRTSKPHEVEFYMAPERGPAAVKRARLKEAVERPSLFHLTGSYIITNLNYQAENPERGTSNAFAALGGSGRAGLGYTPRGTNWGGTGFAEFSGFSIKGQVFTYFTLEAHATWKKTFGSKVLKLTGGGFLRELPETLASVTNSEQFELEKVRYMGPAAGMSFAVPFNTKIGVQFNARAYYGLIGMGTPNGQSINSDLSYEVSVLGSWRVTRKITGLLGYAMKTDAISYNSLSSEESAESVSDGGEKNSINLSGHYLNLMFEWGF